MLYDQRKSMHIHDTIQNHQTPTPHSTLKSERVNPKIWKYKNQATSYQLLGSMQPKDHNK